MVVIFVFLFFLFDVLKVPLPSSQSFETIYLAWFPRETMTTVIAFERWNKIRKSIYDYFPKFYYFMMTSSVTSAFFWQVVLSEFTIRQDLSLYVWCDLETVSILLTRNMSWLLLLWGKLRNYCISYRLVCNTADFYHSEYCFSHQLLKSEPISLIKKIP